MGTGSFETYIRSMGCHLRLNNFREKDGDMLIPPTQLVAYDISQTGERCGLQPLVSYFGSCPNHYFWRALVCSQRCVMEQLCFSLEKIGRSSF